MFEKAFDFLVTVAFNGLIAIFVAIFFYIILVIVFAFAMIPILILAGDGVANSIMNFIGGDLGYKVIYAIVFISMMMDDLGVPNIKTAFKKWRVQKGE